MKTVWLWLLCSCSLWSQQVLQGIIFGQNQQHKIPLENAEIFWLNTKVYTFSDAKGNFSIPYQNSYKKLIVNYVGYKTDTLWVASNTFLEHTLQPDLVLQEVQIASKKKNFHVSHQGVNLTEQISKGELLKAACCNLSESFETNPSIDVSFTDALTGIKQIQMLGLSSPYLQYTQENIPAIRGANQLQGFAQIPGTWIEGIQISKGAGSVINGYESISGQINYELKKPESAERFFVNLYGSEQGRMELNTHVNRVLTDHLSTGVYIHFNTLQQKNDHNDDYFLDTPLGNQINFMNRWSYNDSHNNLHSSLIIRYLQDNRQSGQLDFNPELHRGTTQFWGSENQQKRWDVYTKLGFVFPELPYKSLGFQFNYAQHTQESYYGLKKYDITHNSLYFNMIYQSILLNTYHQFKTGLSATSDRYNELVYPTDYSRTDKSSGVFFEYNFQQTEKFSLNTGIRVDYHNQWKFFTTYRLHLRWQPLERTTLRGSLGNGTRNANIFIENPQLWVTNRTVHIDANTNKAYGLEPERAVNMGINALQSFTYNQHKGSITAEYYYTYFNRQVVADWEQTRQLRFYNVNGNSEATSFQIMTQYEWFTNFETRIAYKNTQQNIPYQSGKKSRPLQPKDRWFINVAYQVKNNEGKNPWLLDYTWNRVGSVRIPDTSINPESSQLPKQSDPYFLMNGQISKFIGKNWSFYVGGENLTNTTQDHVILGHLSPFGTVFDGSLLYAPIDGRMIYAGLRFELK